MSWSSPNWYYQWPSYILTILLDRIPILSFLTLITSPSFFSLLFLFYKYYPLDLCLLHACNKLHTILFSLPFYCLNNFNCFFLHRMYAFFSPSTHLPLLCFLLLNLYPSPFLASLVTYREWVCYASVNFGGGSVSREFTQKEVIWWEREEIYIRTGLPDSTIFFSKTYDTKFWISPTWDFSGHFWRY